MKNFIFLISMFLSFVFSTSLKGQRTFYFTEEWSASGYISTSNFYGDLTDKSNRFFSNTPFSKYFYQDRQAVFGFALEKKINIYFGIRGNISYGNVKSTKESVKQYFTAHVFEYNLMGTVDFTNIFMGYNRYRSWSIYGFLGIGFTESRTWKRSMLTDKIVGTNGFGIPKKEGGRYIPMTETVLPIGLGFKYQFVKEFSLNFEISLHPIRTDKLDATISDDTWRDGYGLISVGATYHFDLPDHWQVGNRRPRYNGKSSDPAIKAFNKKRHTIMSTKSSRRAMKKRYKPKRRRRG